MSEKQALPYLIKTSSLGVIVFCVLGILYAFLLMLVKGPYPMILALYSGGYCAIWGLPAGFFVSLYLLVKRNPSDNLALKLLVACFVFFLIVQAFF